MGSERDRPLAILAGVTMIALAVWSLLRERRTVPAAMALHGHERWSMARLALPVIAVLLLAGIGAAIYRLEQSRAARQWAIEITGGDPARAPGLMIASGCAGCHSIPGVPGARGLVGPPLTGLAERVYIAGVIENTPDNLILWIQNARGVDPQTAMPTTGIPERDARDIAAYLYALR
jgi:cytochrome c1